MASLALKIFMCPIGIIIAAWLFPNVEYAALYQPITVGIVAAIIGVLMEYLILSEETLWMSTIADFVASLVVVYVVSNLFAGAYVTFFGALLTAIILSVVEYFTHLWLIKSGRTHKTLA